MRFTQSIKKNHSFRFVYSRGQSVASRFLVLYVCPGKTPGNLLGVTVSKKVGNAVTRNRVRRLITENYRLLEPHIKQGYMLVIVARASAGALDRCGAFARIGQDLATLLRKKQLLQRPEPEPKTGFISELELESSSAPQKKTICERVNPGFFAGVLLSLLRIYKKWGSPWLGARCRFYPSCSVYMYTAVERYGALKGLCLGVKRLLRCQPFCRGGYDPVP